MSWWGSNVNLQDSGFLRLSNFWHLRSFLVWSQPNLPSLQPQLHFQPSPQKNPSEMLILPFETTQFLCHFPQKPPLGCLRFSLRGLLMRLTSVPIWLRLHQRLPGMGEVKWCFAARILNKSVLNFLHSCLLAQEKKILLIFSALHSVVLSPHTCCFFSAPVLAGGTSHPSQHPGNQYFFPPIYGARL